MAFIGLRKAIAAPLATEPGNAEPTYGSGGSVIGKAIQANLTITRNNNPLYADDTIVEDDNSITAMSLELGLDDLAPEDRVKVLGLVKKTAGTNPAVDTYYDTDASAPYVGFGYIRVRRKAGVTSYQACWIYKAKFSFEDESTQTKGESIEWQTPTINGRCMGISRDASGRLDFRARQVFASEADAKTWLNTKAGITP